MSLFDDLASEAGAAVFETFGTPAAYAPPGGGTAIPCTVVFDRRDASQRPDEGAPPAGIAKLEVRTSEVAAPLHGATFMIGTTVYEVANRPQLRDPDGLVWTMWVDPQ